MTITDATAPGTTTPPRLRPGQLFIGGEWREASDGARTDVIDPANGEVFTSIASATTRASGRDSPVASGRACC
jgi:hypothetical protein